jgi:hypothetical protein
MMNLPELDAIELTQCLAGRSRSDATDLAFAELANGLNICRLLRLQPTVEASRYWKIARAQIALEVAEDSMWDLRLSHPDFNQMMALAERLRFEVESLSMDVLE